MFCYGRSNPRARVRQLATLAVDAAIELDNLRLCKPVTMENRSALAMDLESFAKDPSDFSMQVFLARAFDEREEVPALCAKVKTFAARLLMPGPNNELRDECLALSRNALAFSVEDRY